MAKTYAVRPIIPAKYKEGESYRTIPLAASQTFESGAIVTLSGGKVAEAGTDPSSILGVALAAADDYDWMEDTHGTVFPSVPIAMPDQEFRGTLLGTYNSATHVIGFECGVVKDSTTGFWCVDPSDTNNKRVRITGIDHTAENGDTNVPVRFVFLAANQAVVA